MQGVQLHPQNFWFGENPGKMCENVRKIALCALIFTKMAPKTKAQTYFSGSYFCQVHFGKLGEIWTKIVLEVCFDFKKCAQHEKICSRFFWKWVSFFGSFFGQVWGNLGKKSSHSQKFACSYTYARIDSACLISEFRRGTQLRSLLVHQT